jgi:hypothetical protein
LVEADAEVDGAEIGRAESREQRTESESYKGQIGTWWYPAARRVVGMSASGGADGLRHELPATSYFSGVGNFSTGKPASEISVLLSLNMWLGNRIAEFFEVTSRTPPVVKHVIKSRKELDDDGDGDGGHIAHHSPKRMSPLKARLLEHTHALLQVTNTLPLLLSLIPL